MKSREYLPSFLDDNEEKELKFCRFKRKGTLTLMDMVKEELGNTFNPKFISNHRKQLETIHFALEVTNQYKKWTIIKRLPEIVKLEESLKGKYKSKVPSVPIRKQNELNETNLNQALQFFEIFMNVLGKNTDIVEEKHFLKFIENFVAPDRRTMKIFKQLSLSKRAGGRHNQSTFKRVFLYMVNWSKRYFTITSEGVYFTAGDQDFRIEEMIPFSESFKLLYGEAQTGQTYGIILNSAHRMLNIYAQDIYNMIYFVYWIRKAMKQNNYLSAKRFGSFANIRQKCHAQFFIDGRDYFGSVCDAILAAKSEIFITGWMVSPFFCLKRPDPLQQTRFDRVIEKVSQLGIKVNIIIYMEPKVALNIDSEFTEKYLMSLSPNIKVLRHPAYVLIPFLWSHHEKMVIIDQRIAFMGGLDIGYGRFDDSQHLLCDQNQEVWPGVDYCNYRTTDILKPKNYETSSIDRESQPRMPWHDVGIKITGESVIDISRHFVQYWNYVNFQLNMDERELLMYVGLHEDDIADYQRSRQTTFKEKEKDRQKQRNPKSKEKQKESEYISARYSRRISPNRPERKSSARGSDSFFSQIIQLEPNQDDLPIKKSNHPNENPLTREGTILRSLSTDFEVDMEIDHEEQMEFYANHMKGESSKDTIDKFIKKIKEKKDTLLQHGSRQAVNLSDLIVTQDKENTAKEGCQTHQLLRSASMWSLGLEEGHEERSILRAYVESIFNSKEFIYIENQFFISVQNTIAKALIERISRAYEHKEKFKVVVVIPSLPGFQGQIQNQESAVMRIQVHHIYNTICRGGRSILQCLNYIQNIDDYIQFFTLRTHGVLKGKPVSEIVYVHSKVMIVDDEKVIVGSANINDRSMLGSRDSEIAILIEDNEELKVKVTKSSSIDFEDQERVVKKFAHNLRKELYMEHFGITGEEAQDYLNENIWWSIIEHADKNQTFYRKVFGIYPDDHIRSFKDLKLIAEEANLEQYEIVKNLIKGHAVLFQKQFLYKQNLELKASQKQYYVPAINFT